MIERDQNNQNTLALDQLKLEAEQSKFGEEKMNKDNDELIERVALTEQKMDQKDEEV